jgi:uncharacterized repeat protein (TIGR02543 family)
MDFSNYTTPEKQHYNVDAQSARLPLYLQEFYKKRQLDRLRIDGNEIQGYFEYSQIPEKTYVKPPERSSGGTIDNLNSYATFIVDRIVIKYIYMHISDYRKLMRLIQSKNEFTVEFYDIVWDKRVVRKMYFAPPSMPNIHQRYLEVLGVKDYTIELIGTNTDIDLLSVIYHSNPPTDGYNDTTIAEPDVYSGAEIVMGTSAKEITDLTFGGLYMFDHWSLNPTNDDTVFVNNNAYTINNNLVLYARWRSAKSHTLSFSYGIADPSINEENYTYETSRVVSKGSSIGTLPTVQTPSVTYKDKKYYPYYDGYWYKTPIIVDNSVAVKDGDDYWTNMDSTIYLLYKTHLYSLDLYLKDEDKNMLYASNKIPYNTPMNLPSLVKEGCEFSGWYSTADFQENTKVNNGNMPPVDLTLYARFVKI